LAAYANGIKLLTGVQMGSFYRGVARTWFAEGRSRHDPEMARSELLLAKEDFVSLSNHRYAAKVDKMLALIHLAE
jgi:hypothetical protein